MTARMTLSAAILLAAQGVAAAQSCGTALNEFREIVKTETSMGHVTPGSRSRALNEIASIEGLCRAGQNAKALAALRALQQRMGFR